MEIVDWNETAGLNELYRDLRRWALEPNIAELDAYGFTVLRPEQVGIDGLAADLLAAVLEVAKDRHGLSPDLATATEEEYSSATGLALYYLLFEDDAFQRALLAPPVLALITYLLGDRCVLNACTSLLKGPGQVPLAVHADTSMVPPPFPQYAQVANATWVLTDYSREQGSIGFVPGSHRYCRPPVRGERARDRMVPIDAPAGSVIIWHGNTWHGAFPREVPGIRANLIMFFSRMNWITQEPYRQTVTKELLDRHPPRFATLMGQHLPHGWREEGPDQHALDSVLTAHWYS